MEIPPTGKYVCKLGAQAVIYEASTGSLCVALPCVMVDTGFAFKHTLTIVKADGTVQSKTMDTLKQVLGWDGLDPFWLMENSADGGSIRGREFEIVGGPEPGDKGGVYFKVKWLNPIGRGKTPEAADRQAVLAKYGSQFRALAGTTPAPKVAATVPPMPATKSSPTAPAANAPTATMEQAWTALNNANPGKDAKAVESIWFDTIGKLFPNKSNTDLSSQDWGQLKTVFTDNVPM